MKTCARVISGRHTLQLVIQPHTLGQEVSHASAHARYQWQTSAAPTNAAVNDPDNTALAANNVLSHQLASQAAGGGGLFMGLLSAGTGLPQSNPTDNNNVMEVIRQRLLLNSLLGQPAQSQPQGLAAFTSLLSGAAAAGPVAPEQQVNSLFGGALSLLQLDSSSRGSSPAGARRI